MEDVPPSRTPWEETVIHETHVEGLTMRRPAQVVLLIMDSLR